MPAPVASSLGQMFHIRLTDGGEGSLAANFPRHRARHLTLLAMTNRSTDTSVTNPPLNIHARAHARERATGESGYLKNVPAIGKVCSTGM